MPFSAFAEALDEFRGHLIIKADQLIELITIPPDGQPSHRIITIAGIIDGQLIEKILEL